MTLDDSPYQYPTFPRREIGLIAGALIRTMPLLCQSLVLLLLHLVASGAAMLRVLLPGRPIRATALASEATPDSRVPDYAAFDWMMHWYPVMWSRDAPLDKPTRLTLFDTDYAVVLRSDGSPPLALLDVCPHRLAALSEGRLTEQGFLQCAYHGWAFDGEGSCKAIPQRPTGGARPSSACAQAVNAVESQGIVWLNPAPRGTPGLAAVPRVPQMDDPKYRWTPAVRDMPVDYSLLVQNILDPDHGLFAHQAPSFDLYSATAAEPLNVTVFSTGAGELTIEARVAAKPKLIAKRPSSKDSPEVKGINRFTLPSSIMTYRKDKDGETNFLACFFVSPTGVGRSRFMAAGVSKGPVVPRWLLHVFLNNFLDQDTFLLATQQPHVLREELDRYLATQTDSCGNAANRSIKAASLHQLRRKLFQYRSPTEKLLLEVSRFLDETVPRMPNRYKTTTLFQSALRPRHVVLDRYAQHTSICPDSRAASDRLKAGRNMACFLALAGLSHASGCSRSLFKRALAASCGLALFGLAAHLLEKQFHFCYDERKRNADLAKIPTVFADDRLQ